MSISGMKGSAMPAGHIIMILSILFSGGNVLLYDTWKNILSMGYDEQVLRQNGIPVGKYKLSAYILGGCFFCSGGAVADFEAGTGSVKHGQWSGG